ncbi:MAG: AraC family transcriptional regulator [Pseudomonadota bacterium]
MRTIAKSAEDIPGHDFASAYLVCSELQREEFSLRSSKLSYKSVVSGIERYRVNGAPVTLCSGQAFLAPEKEEITVEIDRKAVGQCLYFESHDLDAHFSGVMSKDFCPHVNGFGEVLGLRLPVIPGFPALQKGGRLDACAVDSFLARLAEQLARTQGILHAIDLQRPANARELAARLETARDFIMDHLDRPVMLDQIARAACLSRFHLARHFAAAYGLPPLRFHQHCRMQMARDRLQAGESVTQIAQSLRFSETAAFSRAYKRVHGQSPSAQKSNLDQPH